jgi:hypothetical protein
VWWDSLTTIAVVANFIGRTSPRPLEIWEDINTDFGQKLVNDITVIEFEVI